MYKLGLWLVTSLFLSLMTLRTIHRNCKLYDVTVSWKNKLLVLLYVAAANAVAVASSDLHGFYMLVLGVGLAPLFFIYYKFIKRTAAQMMERRESEKEDDRKPSQGNTRLWVYSIISLLACT